MSQPSRDDLGRVVRDAWIAWARTQPNPKPSWLVPYRDLAEPDKEADRLIGEAVTVFIEARVDLMAHHQVDQAGRAARRVLAEIWRLTQIPGRDLIEIEDIVDVLTAYYGDHPPLITTGEADE